MTSSPPSSSLQRQSRQSPQLNDGNWRQGLRSLRDLTQHLTTRADDNHAPPVSTITISLSLEPLIRCQVLVRFFALLRIKPHAPPLVRAPVNSFEFHPCGHTPQAAHLTRSLRHPGSCPDTQCASFTARTTRVSNPVRSPRLRASASAVRSQPAFAIGVLPDIYRFHPYTWNSGCATAAQAQQFPARFRGWAPGFHARLAGPPTRPLRPMIPNNARALRVTAAAGT